MRALNFCTSNDISLGFVILKYIVNLFVRRRPEILVLSQQCTINHQKLEKLDKKRFPRIWIYRKNTLLFFTCLNIHLSGKGTWHSLYKLTIFDINHPNTSRVIYTILSTFLSSSQYLQWCDTCCIPWWPCSIGKF